MGGPAIDTSLLRHQPVLLGDAVRLEPAGPEHLDGLWPLYSDEDVADAEDAGAASLLAGVARERVRAGLARAREREDRADWAVVTTTDGRVVGEVVLFDLDEANGSMEFRIALVGPQVFGRGYGTEATMLVRDFALGPLGLHRLTLEVNSFNAPALAVYRKAGFVLEGVRRQAVWRDGQWHDVHDMALLDSDPLP